MGQLDGKKALVTGAARGIGRAIAEKLAAEGADVVVCDLNRDWLAETEQAITALGRKALTLATDVSQAKSVQHTVDEALKAFGRLDILINNAGITRDGFLVRMSEEDWDQVLAVNLKGTFLFTKAVSRGMMKQKSGIIVNLASIIGLIGNAGQCNYAASKAGVIALTKSAARELASRNIRVNAVAPGFIETKMTAALPEAVRGKMLDAIPMARFGLPDDVANVVLFLASPASAYMTGQVLSISGGMVM
ncbi:MAG: 3-oxoacyl-[acyl-carrier-protein] reductase [Verrucomicrobia bacterium]|nr:3-oxoacyl-[acyl-carrier-protein] reductase [Verrucomicrobiota bacterium]MBU1734540.1 3-oxoacyl-[acyl-carrier-protein] reductase [Verrucomicrobiota bacterium]MBU1856609.1 3-oxoacyl-[acyl-carrier-protein] reductase [Verrucomicrobiota bacterium]